MLNHSTVWYLLFYFVFFLLSCFNVQTYFGENCVEITTASLRWGQVSPDTSSPAENILLRATFKSYTKNNLKRFDPDMFIFRINHHLQMKPMQCQCHNNLFITFNLVITFFNLCITLYKTGSSIYYSVGPSKKKIWYELIIHWIIN